ncbi:MAG: hypothetical protein OXH75_06285 [Acidobacteria bacterium]|nr:hypothetical protein [Acidobacteriota bacterium]
MGGLNRTVVITTLSLRTLRQRAGASAVATVGMAGVVLVFVAVLSIAEGFQGALAWNSHRRSDKRLPVMA